MESSAAPTLQKKKINKGKLKKTIKNIVCRPDPVFWPAVDDEQKQIVEVVLNKYKVEIPVFQKPLWKDLKDVPKELRPKPPQIEKVNGLLFGLSDCSNSVETDQCSGVMIEALVNPRTIVQSLLELCSNKNIPVICVADLRKFTKECFGIPTSCLGVGKDCLKEISDIIHKFRSDILSKVQKISTNQEVQNTNEHKEVAVMEVDASSQFEYLYRNDKKSRAFIPPSQKIITKEEKVFKGQDFIEFPAKARQQCEKSFKNMIVKRITNNPNRVKLKNKIKGF